MNLRKDNSWCRWGNYVAYATPKKPNFPITSYFYYGVIAYDYPKNPKPLWIFKLVKPPKIKMNVYNPLVQCRTIHYQEKTFTVIR